MDFTLQIPIGEKDRDQALPYAQNVADRLDVKVELLRDHESVWVASVKPQKEIDGA